MKIAAALSPLQARWRAFDKREQTLIRSAAHASIRTVGTSWCVRAW